MCLERQKPATQLEGEGWKVFTQFGDQLQGVYYKPYLPYSLNTWITTQKCKSWDGNPEIGFHIFFDHKDAERWAQNHASSFNTIRRVKYRQAQHIGHANLSMQPDAQPDALTALEMFIPSATPEGDK